MVMADEDKDVQSTGDAPDASEVDEESTTDSVEEEEPPDYRALYEASEATNKQLRNDSRAREGQRNRTQDQEDRMNRMESSVETMARTNAQILSKMMTEDDEFAGVVRKENEEAETQSRANGVNGRINNVLNNIMGIVQTQSEEDDADPVVLISKENQDKLTALWGAAAKKAKTGDESDLHRVQMEATRMVLEEEQARSRRALAEEREKSKAATKKALEKAGVADQDTGPARAGAGGGERKRGLSLIQEAIEEGSPLFPGAKSASV